MTDSNYDPDLSRYEDSELFWGEPYVPDYYRCKACGLLYWREFYFFWRCPRCQSVKIELFGSWFLKPRPRRFLNCKSRIRE